MTSPVAPLPRTPAEIQEVAWRDGDDKDERIDQTIRQRWETVGLRMNLMALAQKRQQGEPLDAA